MSRFDHPAWAAAAARQAARDQFDAHVRDALALANSHESSHARTWVDELSDLAAIIGVACSSYLTLCSAAFIFEAAAA